MKTSYVRAALAVAVLSFAGLVLTACGADPGQVTGGAPAGGGGAGGILDLLVSKALPLVLGTTSVGGALAAGIPMVLNIVRGQKASNDDGIRSVIEYALNNGIGLAIAKRAATNPTTPVTAPLSADDVAAAKQYVETQIPEKLSALGVQNRDLGDMILSRFGKLLLDRLLPPASTA